jgi:hypothetical protein
MSDSRKLYRTIRAAILQLYPGKIKGNTARMLTILAAMVIGIVMGKSCQLPTIARKAPDLAKADSRVKRYSRWINNEKVNYEGFYLSFISEILNRLAEIRKLVFVMDGSEVGNGYITRVCILMIAACLAYLWVIYLGFIARQDWMSAIHRVRRCDWSVFRLGLAALHHC